MTHRDTPKFPRSAPVSAAAWHHWYREIAIGRTVGLALTSYFGTDSILRVFAHCRAVLEHGLTSERISWKSGAGFPVQLRSARLTGSHDEGHLRYRAEGMFSKKVVVANDLQECPAALQGSAISWIVPPRDLGLGGGCNLGARRHPAAKYAFLNADVILKPVTVTSCLDALDLRDVDTSAPVPYFPDGELQSGCGLVSKYIKMVRLKTPGPSTMEYALAKRQGANPR